MANHGLPKIVGYPPIVALGERIMKSVGYSHESRVTIISSTIPSSLIVELSRKVQDCDSGSWIDNI